MSYWDFENEEIPEWKVNDTVSFGISFTPKDYSKTDKKELSFSDVDYPNYLIHAKVLHTTLNDWIIDFGRNAISSTPPKLLKEGDYIVGKFVLSISAWQSTLQKREEQTGIPLRNEWKINRIWNNQGNELLAITKKDRRGMDYEIEVSFIR